MKSKSWPFFWVGTFLRNFFDQSVVDEAQRLTGEEMVEIMREATETKPIEFEVDLGDAGKLRGRLRIR